MCRKRGNASRAPLPLCGIRLTPALSSKQAQRNRTDTCIDYQNHGIIPLTGLTRSVAVQLTPTTTRYTHRVSINFHRFTDQPFPLSGKMLPGTSLVRKVLRESRRSRSLLPPLFHKGEFARKIKSMRRSMRNF